ncbi:MAG: hypothetical protein ACPL3B_00120 [Fervidobacterium sp.]
MIQDFLNQTAILKTATGFNEYGEPITDNKIIHIRWEGHRKLVRDNKGNEVVSEARFFTLEPIKPVDIVEYGGEEWTVITVSGIPDLDGELVYRVGHC